MKKKYDNQYDKLTKASIASLVVGLGFPTTVSMFVTNVYNMTDTYFVSKLGTSASGATGVVFALMAIIQAFGFMFGHGAGSNISRNLGAKRLDQAHKYASTSFFLSILSGLAITLLGFMFLEPLMRFLGSTDTILPYASTYAAFILIAAPAMTVSCVMNNILRYEGKASLAMIGLTLGGVLNIFGDAILMLHFKMGIMGAGISTAVSQYISALVLYLMFSGGHTQSKFSLKYFSGDFHIISSIVAVGFPSLIRQGLGSVSTMFLNTQAAVYGDAAIAAMSIVSRVTNFLFCVGLGIGQGFQPVCAFNYGAKKYARVKKALLFTLAFGTIVLGAFATVGYSLSYQIVCWFRNDPSVLNVGVFALKLECISLLFMPISVVGNMLFQSIGKSVYASVLSSLRSGLCFIPLILILPRFFGILGIQSAEPVANVLAGLITVPFIIGFIKQLPSDKEETLPLS